MQACSCWQTFSGLLSVHSYWVGSQANGGNPIYQYRIILPVDDDKMINVATDLDFNIEGEAKCALTPNISAKSTFTVRTTPVCAFSISALIIIVFIYSRLMLMLADADVWSSLTLYCRVWHPPWSQNGEQNKSLSLELELTDESSATQFKFTRGGADEFSMSFMQCILPALSLGGTVYCMYVCIYMHVHVELRLLKQETLLYLICFF